MNMNTNFKTNFLCVCLLFLLLAGCIIYFFVYKQPRVYHNSIDYQMLNNMHINYAYANHILKQNELGEILKRGLHEAECSELFGENNPEIFREEVGQITHIYRYFCNDDLDKKQSSKSQVDHMLFFELTFCNYILENAIEVRNAIPKAYYDYTSFGQCFAVGDSMNKVEEILGKPKEIVYEAGQTRFKYVYGMKPEEMLFSKKHALICIMVFFKDEKLSSALYEINDVGLEQTGERLFIKIKCQRHYCLVDKNTENTFEEDPSVSWLPLEQFGIRSIPQLKRKLSKMYIACEEPFSLSFKP